MNLQLSLKTKWFNKTKSGEKTEDYREITIFWFKRLIVDYKSIAFQHNGVHGFIKDSDVLEYVTSYQTMNRYRFKDYETNTMTRGYPKKTETERIIKLEHKGIEIRTGNPDWGAEPNKLYFVIKHGKPINN